MPDHPRHAAGCDAADNSRLEHRRQVIGRGPVLLTRCLSCAAVAVTREEARHAS